MDTPPRRPRPSVASRAWRPARRPLASLVAGNAASGVPGLDQDVVCRLAEADDDELAYVGSEEVRGSWRCVRPYDSGLALGVGDLLYATSELRIAPPTPAGPPIRYVARSEGRAGGRAPSSPATCSPATAPRRGENDFGAADTRGAVTPERCECLMDVGIKEVACKGGKLRNLSFHLTPARHSRRMIRGSRFARSRECQYASGIPRRLNTGSSVSENTHSIQFMNKGSTGGQPTGLASDSYIFSRASQSYMIFRLNSRKFITSNLIPSGSSKNVA